MFMKINRRYEIAFVFGGMLLGLSAGIFIYEAFFLPLHANRSGFAEMFASICLLAGSLFLTLTRAEKQRSEKADDNPDA
jgi:hypothetical protein